MFKIKFSKNKREIVSLFCQPHYDLNIHQITFTGMYNLILYSAEAVVNACIDFWDSMEVGTEITIGLLKET